MTRFATLTQPTTAIGPDGRGCFIRAGRYEIADLDGVDPTLLYLTDPAEPLRLIGYIQAGSATIEETP